MEKRKQKPKKGKVVRISDDVADQIHATRKVGETWGQAIGRIVAKRSIRSTKAMWTLPSKLVPTKAEAVGLAIEEAIHDGRDFEEKETPVKVSEGS